MTLIIMTEGLDLSIGAVLTFSSIVLALTVIATGSVTLAFFAALAVGLCFGLANGVLVALLDIPPFIATLGTLGIAQGLSLLVTDGQSVVGIPPAIEHIYSGTVAGIPLPVIIAALPISRRTRCSITRASAPTSSRSAATARRCASPAFRCAAC